MAFQILKELKAEGIKIAVCSNSDIPARQLNIMKDNGIDLEIFDTIVISGDYGVRKPNPAII